MEVELGDLRGPDGNAFAILARCEQALKAEGESPAEIARFMDEAKSGDYEHLLDTVLDWFEDVDESIYTLRAERE